MNKSNICYLRQAKSAINRDGGTLNLITGCRHYESDICNIPCWARRMVKTRFKAHPAYPYGFEPTFHPLRVKAIGGKPKLIALNFMGDVGGDWKWGGWGFEYSSEEIANQMLHFANLNSQHIILLLTKNPSWYRLAEWPDNVWCGFSATNNEELFSPAWTDALGSLKNCWVSLEPWLDEDPPMMSDFTQEWLVIGGLSGPGAQPVSNLTLQWLRDLSIKAKRFTKRNALGDWPDLQIDQFPREYPEEWKVVLRDKVDG